MISITLAAIFLGLFLYSLLIQLTRFHNAITMKKSFDTVWFLLPAIFLTGFYLFSHLWKINYRIFEMHLLK